jgi:hypothetical protein
MIMKFSDNEHLILQLACDTFRSMQGAEVNTIEHERLSKRWEEEKAAVLWLVLSRFVDDPDV